ncbi:MAG TPA: mechanosensitive ion channel domain-containing protein [Acidimicrobiales bacterium]|nr:mechanosensitive ion channel domain-containing protein [Acidimicrobiales bacterium]
MNEHGLLYDLLRRVGLSDLAASSVEWVVVRPLRVLVVVAVALVVARVSARAIRRAVRHVRSRAAGASSVRAEQRASTLGDVLASSVRAVVWGVAVLVILDEFGVNLAPLLAGAGIAGIAIGFGAQSLVKDVVSGVFILLEDQFGVGDIVTIDGCTGTVEDLTVRVTRLRTGDGTVWFVPNGEIRRVGNSSMEWSKAVVDVVVAHETELEGVRRAMKEEADILAAAEAWEAMVLEPPPMPVVQATDASSVTLRLSVKVVARQHYAVSQELRARISERLRRDGVPRPAAAPATTAVATAPAGPAPPAGP